MFTIILDNKLTSQNYTEMARNTIIIHSLLISVGNSTILVLTG